MRTCRDGPVSACHVLSPIHPIAVNDGLDPLTALKLRPIGSHSLIQGIILTPLTSLCPMECVVLLKGAVDELAADRDFKSSCCLGPCWC